MNTTGTIYDFFGGGLTLPICDSGSVTLAYMGNDTWRAGVSCHDGTAVQKEIENRTGIVSWIDGYPQKIDADKFQNEMAYANGYAVVRDEVIDDVEAYMSVTSA